MAVRSRNMRSTCAMASPDAEGAARQAVKARVNARTRMGAETRPAAFRMRLRPAAPGRPHFLGERDEARGHEANDGGPDIDAGSLVFGAGRQGDGVENRSGEGCEHWGLPKGFTRVLTNRCNRGASPGNHGKEQAMPREFPAHLWVSALLRRASLAGAFAVIVHRGDEQRGDVLVKVTTERGKARLYAPAFNPEGPTEFEQLWLEGEAEVDAAVAKRLKMDRDLWVIEIEDREGRHFLTERVREA